nr:MAG TPA: hypothetical protein [Bacteriophage sp.]
MYFSENVRRTYTIAKCKNSRIKSQEDNIIGNRQQVLRKR